MPFETATKVLLVEDSKSFAIVMRGLIEDERGFEVVHAESLAELNEVLKIHSDDFFVAVVDYHLPDAPDGEAINLTVEKDVPTLVFTGKKDRSIEEDLWLKGIADYTNKFGAYNLDYVAWMVSRIDRNRHVEILVVDDSNTTRLSVQSLLQRQNFKVHLAKSGEEALTILDNAPNIHVAIVDCHMEGMSGFTLTTRIRESYTRAQMEVIGISSYGGRSMAAQFIKSGASDFVIKPLIPEEFLCRVNNAVDRIDAYIELDKLNQLKSQFLGATAHDIRGPLGSIKTAADFLLKRDHKPERRDTLLQLIRKSSADLLELVETLLDVSVIESGKPNLNINKADISEALHERIELYQHEARSKNIVLKQKIQSNIEAEVDLLKIKQVFDNLITNAIKYSEVDGIAGIRLESNNSSLNISVQDAGPGISEEEQEHLFKAFSVLSTKATGGEKKTGLGLAITKSIVTAHGGTIEYEHNEKVHSTFKVSLPLKAL